MSIKELTMWIVLGILVSLLIGLIHKKFKENNVWENVVKKYKENHEKKLGKEADFISKFGSIENKSLFYRFDRLVLTCGIKRYLPWINGERYLLILSLAFVAGLVEGIELTGNGFAAIFLGAAQFVLLYVVLLYLAGKTYNQIEDTTSVFVSILSNHAKGSSDIMTIMQNTMISMTGPIRDLIQRFLLDCERTGNVDVAFDYMKESVENRQFQIIVANLKNCMHYQANYEEVLSQMMGQIAASLSAREERKNILFSMKLTLVVISIASVMIVLFIGSGLGIDVKEILTGNLIGQAIMFITGILYLFVAVKLFGTDK